MQPETLNKLGFILGFGFSWLITFVYPPLHKMLRSKIIYYTLLIISILFSLMSMYLYDSMKTNIDKQMSVSSTYPIIYFISYKIYDAYILKKYNRHIYFWIQNYFTLEDDEASQATALENLFQFSLLIIPLLFCWALIELLVS